MHASIFLSEVLGILVSYLSVYYPCYQGLGTILVIFYVLLSLPRLGLTMGIGYGWDACERWSVLAIDVTPVSLMPLITMGNLGAWSCLDIV
jgi:hypothetical protein